jgi:glycosyltransferase involved in cell wall biosynthesis
VKADGVLVSILTPSFNQAPFLKDCLDSVANQTHVAVEHVVCDGGSSDGSLELLRQAPPHVSWRSEPDAGQADAVNKAFGLSSGSIIGWLNSDDAYADRRTIAWTVDVFERHPAVDVVFGHALLVNEQNRVLQLIWTPVATRRLLRLAHYIFQPTVFFRREALERQQRFLRDDLDFVFDRELLLRLLATSRFHRVDRVLAIDRHQRARKVESAAYLAEAAAFDASIGIEPTRVDRALASALRIGLRAGGIAKLRSLPREVDPAVPLIWPQFTELLRLQLATRRRRMPFASQ